MESGKKHVSMFQGVNIPKYDFIINCMHCGLCLPVCPTYYLTGLEKSSPRGRIRLIKFVSEGSLPISDGFINEMQFCLDCQACETACPAGVKYGSIVEAVRAQLFQQKYEPLFSRILKKIFLDWFFSTQFRLHTLGRMLWFYKKSGLKSLVMKTRFLEIFSKQFSEYQQLYPEISTKFSSKILQNRIQNKVTSKYRVGFLTGCIMDIAYSDVNMDTVDLLQHFECEVIVPKNQICCGSIQAHFGQIETAKRFAKHNIKVFEKEELDFIVMNSAGCGAFMKEYGQILSDDPIFHQRAKNISSKVKDLTEFLLFLGVKDKKTTQNHYYRNKRITYHDACHLAHTQKITQQPRELLRSFNSYEYIELPESNWCCGSAGIYNIVHYDASMKILERKIENILSIKPDVIVTANPGCMLQIEYGLAKRGFNIEIVHTATFLKKLILDISEE